MTIVERPQPCRFEHDALVYESDDEYVAALAPLLDAALGAGDAALAVVPDRNAELLRSSLGSAGDVVTWVDAVSWYRHPVRTVAAYDTALRRIDPGRSAFVVGEVQFGTSERDWREWTRYEAALNGALDRHAARVVCPYDRRSLPSAVVEHARRTHPFLLEAGGRMASTAYVEPTRLLRELPADTAAPDGPPDVDVWVGRPLREARRAFVAAGLSFGFAPGRVDELAVGVNEVLTNAVVHGGGEAHLRVWWRGDGGLVCVIDDNGPGIDDGLAGFRPPPPGAEGGYGLWLTGQLFDRFALGRSPDGGLRVRLVALP